MSEERVPTPWRRLAIGSFLTLVLVAVLWNAAALAIDASELGQEAGSWGQSFASFIGTVIYGGPPLVLSFVAALVAAFGSPRAARVAAWCITVLAALCAVGLLAVAVLIATATGTQADNAFGAASGLLGSVLLVPLILCVRRARNERHLSAGATSHA